MSSGSEPPSPRHRMPRRPLVGSQEPSSPGRSRRGSVGRPRSSSGRPGSASGRSNSSSGRVPGKSASAKRRWTKIRKAVKYDEVAFQRDIEKEALNAHLAENTTVAGADGGGKRRTSCS